MSRYRSDEEEYGDEEEELPPPPPPRRRPPSAERLERGERVVAQPARRPQGRVAAPPPRQGMSPNVLMGFMGGMIIGLLGLVVLLLLQNRTPGGSASPGIVPTSAPISADAPTVAGGGAEAERMTLEDFKKLYDDPAKRPLIVDVRAKDAYDQGHIEGAVSVPESDIDTRFKEIPRDKLVVAYCQ
ncbi:MAG TPA: rhodanese-like domain-containing protein [Chloroflexia bacterium]|nr:rhodanese-like domain-containing protein [Chloroflexia bacterium]